MSLRILPILLVCCALGRVQAQDLVLDGAHVLSEDGSSWREGVSVHVERGRIRAIAAPGEIHAPAETKHVDLSGKWLVPGLIDLHTHLLLRPYDEMSWNDQVLKESLELRTIRATVHARATLDAGFTTIRELGTEGAGFADVALRDSIARGIVPGPRVFAATRAMVATGCYGPAGFDPRWSMPIGAQVADGVDGVRKAVREQIAAGADWIKYYADYRRRPGDRSTPTFAQDEVDAIVAEARSAGLPVAAHASTSEGILRAVRAGVTTIEHGTEADDAALRAMHDARVVLCPTLAAGEAIMLQSGANPAVAKRLDIARITFQRALAAGVTIACGSDAGVFAHGHNAREIELMVEFGMSNADALRAATAVAARVLGHEADLGRVSVDHVADLVALDADPLSDITALRRIRLVVKDGRIAADPSSPRK
ncbi:MAG: amidohydrolase family protein [Planctomycetota bacterium]